MAKRVAVMVLNPVNGFGLFHYLETFFENGIPYKTFAVADSKEVKTNSGVTLFTDDVIANLKGNEDEFDALVFACGDAFPVLKDNMQKQYNLDLADVIKTFHEKGKIHIGHCAAGLVYDKVGILNGNKVAVHPFAKPAVHQGKATDEQFEIDKNIYTAQTEKSIWAIMPEVLKALK